MDWILDNLFIVIAVAAAIASWLNKRKQDQTEADAADEEAGTRYQTRTAGETDEEARARRIREEIRRKISERTAQPPPLFRREPDVARPVAFPLPRVEDVPSYLVPEEDHRTKAVLERQRMLQEQMQALEQAQLTAKRRAHEAAAEVSRTESMSAPGTRLKADLKDRTSLRRAVVLREVLGPPVALR